jgi:dihydroorotate dehydrogenase (fumarate)
MVKLDVSYLGLKLRNPVLVSSSGLTDSADKIKKLEEFGAGAVVLKSLFEEQINYEAGHLLEQSDYPEAEDYIRNYTKSNSLEEYLTLIESAKKAVQIPVIASVNCISASDWISFSKKIESAGADAIEVNVFVLPSEPDRTGSEYEQVYYDLATQLKKIISIPIAIKLGSQFSNILFIIKQLYNRGVEGVVLFNRFYAPDMDLPRMKLTSSEVFSSPADIRQTLRWVGIASGKIDGIDIAASTGIHNSDAIIKQILAGASVVQVCSTLYKNGVGQLVNLIAGVEEWMETNNFGRIGDFKGILSYKNITDPSSYERSQFMKYFSNYH